jgi:hypothetical protein
MAHKVNCNQHFRDQHTLFALQLVLSLPRVDNRGDRLPVNLASLILWMLQERGRN